MAQVRQHLPYMNFYRFCQLLEQSQTDAPVPGSGWLVRQEPVRFRPHPGMGFPSSEIRGIEDPEPEHSHLPPTVRVNFMGLYGVESPLPTHYIDDIAQRRDGCEATRDFLDIFNHRLITQYYRIWRKYSYPATYQAGGADIWARTWMCGYSCAWPGICCRMRGWHAAQAVPHDWGKLQS